jgi:hypothetical protein
MNKWNRTDLLLAGIVVLLTVIAFEFSPLGVIRDATAAANGAISYGCHRRSIDEPCTAVPIRVDEYGRLMVAKLK